MRNPLLFPPKTLTGATLDPDIYGLRNTAIAMLSRSPGRKLGIIPRLNIPQNEGVAAYHSFED